MSNEHAGNSRASFATLRRHRVMSKRWQFFHAGKKPRQHWQSAERNCENEKTRHGFPWRALANALRAW